jgi:hypothetical protein
MTKKFFNWRNVVAVATCLAATTIFSGCDPQDNPHDNGSEVQVEIRNFPFSTPFGYDDGGNIYVYPQKPVQWNGWIPTDGQATGMISKEYPIATLRLPNFENYGGGDGYLHLVLYIGVSSHGMVYQQFISKEKVGLLAGAINIFDFNTDFEILHEFGGSQGILRIEGVPQEYRYGIDVFEIFDYSGTVEDIEDYSALKPVGFKGEPDVSIDIIWQDYLAIPLLGIKNQHWDDVADIWQYEFTGNRFNLSGTYLIQMSGFSPDHGLKEMYYAEGVKFTNGRATIKWGDIKFIAN